MASTHPFVFLVLAPFGGSWSEMHETVSRALESDDIDVTWANAGAELDAPVAGRIHEYIEDADAVVADLTELNPNVMYELGFARALKKPVLPVVAKGVERVPAVVRGRLFYVYDKEDPQTFIALLKPWLERQMAPSMIEDRVA